MTDEPTVTHKVISLHGGLIPSPGDPNYEIVEYLETALERAKAGEITGIAAVEIDGRNNCEYAVIGPALASYSMIGAVQVMGHAMTTINVYEDGAVDDAIEDPE